MIRVFALFLLLAPFLTSWANAAPLSCALLLEHGEPAPYTEMLRAGLERAAKEFGLAASVIVATPDDDQTAAFEKAARENDMVIVATDGFFEILRDNAANFRRCKFAVVDAGIRAPNTSCLTFADEQAAFLAGAAAAMLARERDKPVIGWLSGMDTPAIRSLFSGYAAGAETAAPEVRIIQTITGSFTDREAAAAKAAQLREAAVAALAAGAANGAAAKSLQGGDIFLIGLDALQPEFLPQRTIGVISKAVDRAVYELCRDLAAGQFRAKEIVIFDLANGGVDFTVPEKSAAKKWPAISRRLTELKKEIMAGNIHLGSMRERTLCNCLD